MPNILPVSDLRNYNEVLKNCQVGEPVFLTKNGRGKFVVMDIEDYEREKAEKKLLMKLQEAEEAVKDGEGWLNLEELKIDRKQKLSSISYGQQKKAMLAYAFALHTPYILLDEPTNGLDITSRQALKRIISRSMDDESTLLISTHQAHDFENLLDHLIICLLYTSPSPRD